MRVLRPNSLADALTLLASQDAPLMPIAGGTDLCVSWHAREKDAWCLLDLSQLARELRYVRMKDDWLEIGALATYWDVMRNRDAASAFPLLVDAGRQVGAIQIQTRGTWAGNIGNGSPAADGVPVLVAYDATVVLASLAGTREVPLDAYYTGYRKSVRREDELIAAIRLPRRERRVEWFHKVGARQAQAITKVGAAVVADECGWRVVANSVAAVVCRCRNVEAAFQRGDQFDTPDALELIATKDIQPIDDIRSTAAYRSRVFARLLWYRFFESSEPRP